MTDVGPRFVTPAEVRGLLESFCPVTERTLEDWRRRRALPSLVRQSLGSGCGRGAMYGWTDSEILVQVATLKFARDTYAQLKWMKLAAWFSGFDYPHDEMRLAWKWWCRHDGVDALAQYLGWPAIGDTRSCRMRSGPSTTCFRPGGRGRRGWRLCEQNWIQPSRSRAATL